MADKAERKPDNDRKDPAAPPGGKKEPSSAGGRLLSKTPVLLGGVMIIEAAVLFAGFKFLGGGPQPSYGAELVLPEDEGGEGGATTQPVDKSKPVAVKVIEFRAPNKSSGRTFFYDLQIFIDIRAEHQKMVEETIREREPLIQDRVRTIIAQSDPEKLGGGSEPGLETLRRQVKYQLDDIIGQGLIEEVLIPRCTPFRADY